MASFRQAFGGGGGGGGAAAAGDPSSSSSSCPPPPIGSITGQPPRPIPSPSSSPSSSSSVTLSSSVTSRRRMKRIQIVVDVDATSTAASAARINEEDASSSFSSSSVPVVPVKPVVLPVGVELTALPGTSELIVRRVAATGPFGSGSGSLLSGSSSSASSSILMPTQSASASASASLLLQPGMQILSVNGTSLCGKTPAQATAMLQAATAAAAAAAAAVASSGTKQSLSQSSRITLECGGIPVTLLKPTKEARLGLTLYADSHLGCVRIQKIIQPPPPPTTTTTGSNGVGDTGSSSLSPLQLLQVGQRITAIQTSTTTTTTWINPTSHDAKQVLHLLHDAVGPISISAIDIEGMVTTVIPKPLPLPGQASEDSKIGMVLRLHEDIEAECVHHEHNYIFIRKITKGGLLDQALSWNHQNNNHNYINNINNGNDGNHNQNNQNNHHYNTIKGHRVLSINGQACPEDLATANEWIRQIAPSHPVILETIPVDWGLTAQQLQDEPSIPILQHPGQVLATILCNMPTNHKGSNSSTTTTIQKLQSEPEPPHQQSPSPSPSNNNNNNKKIGLKLTRVFNDRHGGSRLVISHIDKELKLGLLGGNNNYNNNNAAAAATVLQLGMHLLSINGRPCHSTMTATQASELLEHATSSGMVHIVASPIIAQVTLPPPAAAAAAAPGARHNNQHQHHQKKLSLGLTLDKQKVGIVVGKIHDGGLLDSSSSSSSSSSSASDLQAGQKIISINGQPCPHDLKEAMELLSEATTSTSSSLLTIQALDVVPEMIPTEWPDDCIVTATTYKPTPDTVVGIGLNKSIQGRVVISRISETGLLARSPLQIGLVVLSINGVSHNNNHKAAVQSIKDAKGILTIVCAKSVEYARKPSMSQSAKTPVKMGISLGRSSKGGIVIADIDATSNGLFQWGVLKRNQRVVKINGQPCPDRVQDAVTLLKEVPSGNIVSIEAVDTLRQQSEWPDDCLITISATKTKQGHAYMGLRFAPSTTAPRVVLSSIDTTIAGPFFGLSSSSSSSSSSSAKKLLLPGMVVVAISGRDCPETCDETIDLLDSIPVGNPVTMVVAKTVSHLYKRSSDNDDDDEKWGLSLAKTAAAAADGKIITILKIDPKGAVAKLPRCLLKLNQRVVNINGHRCPKSVKDAADLLREAREKIVMTTVDCFEHPWSAKEECVVTVTKRTATTRVGLGLMKSTQGRVAVSSVDDVGLFGADSGIQLGYVIHSINGKPCPANNVKDAIDRIRQTIGDLTIVFAKTVASVEKADPEASWGIKLGRTRKQGIIVHDIGSDSVFAATNLMAQQKILSINGIPCPPSLEDAIALLRNAKHKVTVEAVDAVYPVWSPECLLTISVFKATRQKFVGLDFALSQQGRLAVSRVDGKGLFANKGLTEGLVVVSVNGKAVHSAFEVRQIVQDCIGELTLVAARAAEQAVKMNMDTAVGLVLGLDPAQGIIIEKIEPHGMFASSRLLVGQTLVSIDGQPCPSNIPEAIALLKQAEGPLQIVARDTTEAPLLWSKGEGLVTAIVRKEKRETKVGIGFSVSTQGRIVVASIQEDSLLANSGLEVGQLVVSINDEPMPATPLEASHAVRDREVEVSIVAASVVATGVKKSKEDPVGLVIGRSTKGLVINNVEAAGIFSDSYSLLREGQIIRSINGDPCPEKIADAVTMLREAQGVVKLCVVDSLPYKFEWPKACLTTVRVVKDYPGQYVGLEVAQSVQGRIAVARVDEKGIFSGKGLLYPGLVILKINNAKCPTAVQDVIQLMNTSPAEVKLVVAKSIACIEKPSKESKIGLTIGLDENQDVVITEIEHSSLFSHTPLSKGQRVLSINGKQQQQPISTVEEATSLIQETEGELSVEAVDAVSVGPRSDSEALFTAIAKKTTNSSYCGIGVLRSLQGRVCIGRVDESGIFAGSGLMPGHILISINGMEAPENVQKAAALLGSQDDGDIGIVVATTIARAARRKDSSSASSSSEVGLSLWKNSKEDGVAVHSISPGGLFHGSPLEEQQQILSINGQPCPSEVKAAVHMLAEAMKTKELMIVALDGIRPEWPAECIVTSTVQKSSVDDYIGVEVKRMHRKGDDHHHLVISRIDDLGLFATSPNKLMLGQILVSINGTHFPSSPEEMLSNLQEAKVGELVLVTAVTVARVKKRTQETELGISLGTAKKPTRASSTTTNATTTTATDDSDSPGIIVTRIVKDSPFAMTMLHEGQRIVTINGQPCPQSPPDAIVILKSIIGPLTMEVVESVPPEELGVVTVSIRKRNMGTKLGISMRKSLQGRIIISDIAKDGVLAATSTKNKLCIGQHVLSINHLPCPESTKEAVDRISKTKGVVVLVVSSTIARVPKTSKDAKFGLSFAKNSNGVVIYRIESTGLFGRYTSLQVGQKVVSINGQPCPSEVADAVKLVQDAKDFVEIEALDVLFHWTEDDKEKRDKSQGLDKQQ